MNTRRLGVLLLVLVTVTAARAQIVNVEVDYMVETGAGAHSHELLPAEEEALEQMFACHGLTLNLVVDDAIPHLDVMICDDPDVLFFEGDGPDSFAAIKDEWFDGGEGWHYAVFGHQFGVKDTALDNSGVASNDGWNFVVTLKGGDDENGSPFSRASTFAHELGHNLGLDHAPIGESSFTENHSPVYASVMSYAYQLNGVRTGLKDNGLIGDTSLFKDLDYSSGRLPTLLEDELEEKVGVGISTTDFDCDGTIESGSISHQLDSDDDKNESWCGESGTWTELSDQDDWAVILGNLLSEAPVSPRPTGPCAPERATASGGALMNSGEPELTTEPCHSAEMYWIRENGSMFSAGSGDDQGNLFLFVYLASEDLVPDDSILYLQPGDYTQGGLTLEITSPLILAGPGGAVIDP